MRLGGIILIIMIILVWASGYKWKTLWPIGITILALFTGGRIIRASHGSLDDAKVFVSFCLTGLLITLIVMYLIKVVKLAKKRREFRRSHKEDEF